MGFLGPVEGCSPSWRCWEEGTPGAARKLGTRELLAGLLSRRLLGTCCPAWRCWEEATPGAIGELGMRELLTRSIRKGLFGNFGISSLPPMVALWQSCLLKKLC